MTVSQSLHTIRSYVQALALALALVSQPATPPAVTYTYYARVERIVDGDTVDLYVASGFKHVLRDRFRLEGIDAWETRGPERERGLAATRALAELIDGKPLVIDTHGDKRGKYGRWIATIWVDGVNVNEWLVEHGHAERVEY